MHNLKLTLYILVVLITLNPLFPFVIVGGALERSYGILGIIFFVPTIVLYTMGWLKLRSNSEYDQQATAILLGRKYSN